MQNQQLDVESVFMEALQVHSPEDRRAYLDQQCDDDAELRCQIEDLLRAHEDAGSFLESPPVGLAATIASGGIETVDDYTCEVSLGFLAASDKPNCLGTLGQYEVIDVVGRGGMGLVLRAYDTKLNRVVAIKVMAPALAANAMAVKRFLREARSAAAVSHDHVVTIHAIEETNDPPFIVMEFVEGLSLQEKVDQAGAFELKEILRIGMQIASGLEAAHQQGLVHRDIKPANILLENGVERVKITDFGLARAVDDIGVTQTGQIAGTPQYMSPEQAQGHAVDHRTDLFSLGSVLYTMCTGRAAFRADNAVAVLRRVADESPRPIHDVNSEVPTWLERIVEKLLAKEADDRFDSAEEVANLLRGHLAHLQHPATEPQPQPVSVAKPAKLVATNRRPGFKGYSRYVTLALIMIGLICGGAAVIYVETDKGTLVIESPSDDVEVVVSKGGKQIRVVDTSNGSVVVRLPSGAYEVALKDDDHFMISKGQIAVIKRGEEVRVSIRPKSSSATNAQASVTTEQGSGTAVVTVKSDAEVSVTKRQNTVVKRSGEFHASIRSNPSSAISTQAATEAATEWLKLLDKRAYDECHAQSSRKMKELVSKNAFTQSIQGILGQLGTVKKRHFVTTPQRVSTLRSFGEGTYVLLTYVTEFENAKGMLEFVTMTLDKDGTWSVIGYIIQSGSGTEMRPPKSKGASDNTPGAGEASSESETKASEFFRRLSADLDKQVVRVISKNGITKFQPAAPFGRSSTVGKRQHRETGVRVIFDGDWENVNTANKALLAEFERLASEADASIDSRETIGSRDTAELHAFQLHFSTDQGHGQVEVRLENTRNSGSSKKLKNAQLVVTVEEWTQPNTRDPYGLIRRRTSGPNPSNSLPPAEASNTTRPEIDDGSSNTPRPLDDGDKKRDRH